jgi:hypothetical protein
MVDGQLGQDPFDVTANRVHADPKPFGDLSVRPPFG